MRVIGYVRVSTADQAAEGVSLDAQGARIAAWCAANGGELAEGDVYIDTLSGKRADNRPGLQAALDAVCREKGVLVVYSLSRLARSTKDAIAIAERLDRAGSDLVSLSEKIDTTSASGKMVFRMLAVLAEFERDLISERTRGALRHKIARGERCGKVRYGFALGRDGKTLVADVGEQRAIALMAELRRGGLSFRAIAAALRDGGWATRDGNAEWRPCTIQKILKRAG